MTMPDSWSKTFLGSFLVATSLVLMATALLNWVADPAGIFSPSDYESRMAKVLAGGQHIGQPGNFDERLLQKRRSEFNIVQNLDHLVIGSSRALLIDSSMLPGELRNVAVSGAVLEDYVALWTLWKNHRPKTVWIVADPWIFNRNHDQRQWETLTEEFNAGLSQIHRPASPESNTAQAGSGLWVKKAAQLINWEYTKTSWRKVTGKLKAGQFVVLSRPTEMPESDVITSEGNRIPKASTLHPDPLQVDQSAEEFSRKPSYLFKNYYAIDQGLRQIFKDLLVAVQQNSVVVIVLPPIHPLVHERYTRDIAPFAKAESEIIQIARQLDIPLIGSFSPMASGCQTADFYDGIHPLPGCMRRLISSRPN